MLVRQILVKNGVVSYSSNFSYRVAETAVINDGSWFLGACLFGVSMSK